MVRIFSDARTVRRSLIRIAFAILVPAIGACLFACDLKDKKSPPEKVTIAYSAATDAVLAEIAQRHGYYLQEGLEAIPIMRAYGKAALQAVLEGKADFATVADPPVMFAIMR